MANYIKSNLLPSESILLQVKYHWIIFFSVKSLLTLFLYAFYIRWTDQFAITDKRVIIKTGFIARRTLEMNLVKIESVSVDQSILGRILGYGKITIIGTGGTQEYFHNISKPLQFRRTFLENSQ